MSKCLFLLAFLSSAAFADCDSNSNYQIVTLNQQYFEAVRVQDFTTRFNAVTALKNVGVTSPCAEVKKATLDLIKPTLVARLSAVAEPAMEGLTEIAVGSSDESVKVKALHLLRIPMTNPVASIRMYSIKATEAIVASGRSSKAVRMAGVQTLERGYNSAFIDARAASEKLIKTILAE